MESLQENRKLGNMRKNLNKKKKREEKNKNIPFKGIYLFSELIKKQNLAILNQIAKDKLRSKEEREDFIQKFLKINYHIPDIIDDTDEELNQEIYE